MATATLHRPVQKLAPAPKEAAKKVSLQEILREQLLFPVEKKLTEELTGMVSRSYNKHSIVGEIESKIHLIHQCSDSYKLLPNKEIIPVVEQILLENGIAYKATYKHIDNAKFYIEYDLIGMRVNVAPVGTKADWVTPKIMIWHSYNGKLQCQMMFGFFRAVCQNGLTIPVAGKERDNYNFKVKHVDRLEKEYEKFRFYIAKYLAAFRDKRLMRDLAELAARPLDDYTARIEEVVDAVKKFPSTTIDLAIQSVTKEANKLGYQRATDWLVYNGLNQALYSSESDKHPEFKYAIDSEVFDYLLRHPLS
jgi:hypothetical protein